MLCLNDGPFLKTKLSSFSALVFKHIVVLLLLSLSFRGQSEQVGPSRTIVALVGEDVILPCHLEPAVDAVSKSLEWARPELTPRFVHVWHAGQNILVNQNPSYKGRTSVSADKLKHGDLSLHLSAVTHSDNGKYRCLFPSESRQSTVELVVGSVSSPVIAEVNLKTSDGLVLHCKSEGWYPEPEVVWLDAEGNLLPAGPTETVGGPGDLYTVSSRVTVEKRHSSSFTCRVHQKFINQTRETEIHIADNCFEATSSPALRACIVVGTLLVFILFISAAAFVAWKWRQNQTKENETDPEAEAEKTETEQLMTERNQMEDLERKKAELEQRLQNKEDEQKVLEHVVSKLTEHKKELQNQREKLERQMENMHVDDIEKELKSAENMAEGDRAKGYWGMKEIALKAKNELVSRKREDDELKAQTQKLQNQTNSLIGNMDERKEKVENLKKEIMKQLEEIQRELQSDQN